MQTPQPLSNLNGCIEILDPFLLFSAGLNNVNSCQEEMESEVKKAMNINQAVVSFLDGHIDIDTFLDTVEAVEPDIDGYLDDVNDNFINLLGW